MIAEVQITPKKHIQLSAVNNTTSNTLLKSKQAIKEAMCTFVPLATGLQKEILVVQVI